MYKSIYLLVTLILGMPVLSVAQTCRGIEFAELKSMSTPELADYWCANKSALNNLELKLETGKIQHHYQGELQKHQTSRVGELGLEVEQEKTAIQNSANNSAIEKCNFEQKRIERILDARKAGRKAREGLFCP